MTSGPTAAVCGLDQHPELLSSPEGEVEGRWKEEERGGRGKGRGEVEGRDEERGERRKRGGEQMSGRGGMRRGEG